VKYKNKEYSVYLWNSPNAFSCNCYKNNQNEILIFVLWQIF